MFVAILYYLKFGGRVHLYSNSDVATYRVSTDDVYGLLIPHYATIPRLRMSKLFVFVKKWDWVNYKIQF